MRKGNITEEKQIQVYCEICNTSNWLKIDLNNIRETSGVSKRSVSHTDHTVIVEIDNNGSVRAQEAVETIYNPLQTIVEDVSQGMHYINSEQGDPIVIDAYTSNKKFSQFIQSIITEMFSQATNRRIENRFKFVATTSENRTTLHAERLHLSVGPYIENDYEDIENPMKGIILDIEEAETNKLDIDATLSQYDWAAIIVPRDKSEGYKHAFSSMFEEMKTPFFVEVLNNNTLKELFDFIFAVVLTE